jgi:hypothetical protein
MWLPCAPSILMMRASGSDSLAAACPDYLGQFSVVCFHDVHVEQHHREDVVDTLRAELGANAICA